MRFVKLLTAALLLSSSSFSVLRAADILQAGRLPVRRGQRDVRVPFAATHTRGSLLGFSFGITYDSGRIALSEFALPEALGALFEPQYVRASIDNDTDPGTATLAVLLELTPPLLGKALPPGRRQLVAYGLFSVSQDSPSGEVPIEFSEGIGDPPVAIEFVKKAIPPQRTSPATIDGAIEVVPVIPPVRFVCVLVCGSSDVSLSWVNGDTYRTLRVERDGAELGQLAGTEETFLDRNVPEGLHTYRIVAEGPDGGEGAAQCRVFVGGPSGMLALPNTQAGSVLFVDLSGTLRATAALGEGAEPAGVALTQGGLRWVAAPGVEKIFLLNAAGDSVVPPLPAGPEPTHVAASPEGEVFVLNTGDNTLSRYRSDGTVLWGGDGLGDSPEDGIAGPAVELPQGAHAIAVGPRGNVWVACTAVIARVTPTGAVRELDLSVFGGSPSSIACDPRGRLWAVLREPPLLVHFSFDGRRAVRVGTDPYPYGFALGPGRRIWITHPELDRVSVLGENGSTVTTVPLAPGSSPRKIAVDGRGAAWVVCSGNGDLVRISGTDFSVSTFPFALNDSEADGDITGVVLASVLRWRCDFDRDTFTNGEEVHAGSDPFDPSHSPYDVDPTYVAPVGDLRCSVQGTDAELTWIARGEYDSVSIARNGTQIATVGGGETQYRDPGLAEGGYLYEVVAEQGGRKSEARTCLASVGNVSDKDFSVQGSNLVDLAVAPPAAERKNGGYQYSDVFIVDESSGEIAQLGGDGTKSGTIANPFGSLTSTSAVAYGSYGSEDYALYIVGADPESYESKVSVIGLDGELLLPPSELPGLPEGAEPFAADRYTSADPEDPEIFFVAVDPSDPEVFSYRVTPEGAFEAYAELSASSLNAVTGLVRTTGACYYGSYGYASLGDPQDPDIFLLLVGQDAAEAWKIVAVGISAGEAMLLEEIAVEPRGDEITGVDSDEVFIYLIEVLGGELQRYVYHQGRAFLRGNVNEDQQAGGGGQINIADPILVLSYLFADTESLPCPDAADANDDGTVNIADAIYLLAYLFAEGTPPRPPFPEEGFDPTGDSLICPIQ